MNKNDKTATQNLTAESDRSSQTAPMANAGLPDLPPYEVMARQLQQNGVMTQEDIHALDHMEAFDRAMAMAMAMAMSRSALVAVENFEEFPHALEHVRTFTEWKDYVYVARFLQEPKFKVKLPFPNDTTAAYKPNVANYNPDLTSEELEELFWKQNHPEREERLQDIIDQDYDYVPTFLSHLGIDPHQHSNTLRLIETLGFLGATVVMPWKFKWTRPRPSQLDMDLEPAILVPAHHSYPSGHATQAYLTAEALKATMGANKVGAPEQDGQQAKIRAHIDHVAEEIADNREWAGVHYKSDTDAGKLLGTAIWEKVIDIQEFNEFIDNEVKKEWE